MKNVILMVIVALMVGVGTGVSVSEGAEMIDSFQDLIEGHGQPGVQRTSMHMDIDYDLGTLDNLMIRDPDTGIDSIVGEVGIWHLGFYNETPGGFVFGAFANNDNWVADIGPGQAGWMDGYAYDSVFSEGESPDGVLLVFDPDGGQMALKYSNGSVVFDANVFVYSASSIEFDGTIGDLSSVGFTFLPGAEVLLPHMVAVPEPVTLMFLVAGGLAVLRRKRKKR